MVERNSWAMAGASMGSGRAVREAVSQRLVRLRSEERGFSLIELVVAMAILSIVLAGLTTIFVSGTNAQLDLNRRYQAQQGARAALDKIRSDIHCASAAQAQTISTYPGVKLAVGNCSASTPTVSWCAVLVTAAPPRYQLWRSTATTNICTSSDATRTLVADYLTTSTNVFTTSTIPNQGLETVGVDFPLRVTTTSGHDLYELKDSIVARNSTRCVTVGGCSVPSVP
jgi:prepilin-type N-terminal cleavage/methylation domain-containing protein